MAREKHVLGKCGGQHIFGTAKVGDRGLIVSRPEVLSNLATQILDAAKKDEEV